MGGCDSSRFHLFLVDRTPAAFHSWRLCGHWFLALVLLVGKPDLGSLLHASQGEPPTVERSLCNLGLAACGSRTSLFCDSTLPTSLEVASAILGNSLLF